MFRLIFMTFHGESRVAPEKVYHLHESPPVMTLPLIVLAVLAITGGWVGLPDGVLWGDAFSRFLAPAVAHPVTGGAAPTLFLSASATIFALAGIIIAWILYIGLPGLPTLLAWKTGELYTTLARKYYVDEIYDTLIS
jgi:NADH-quinone oxidoreductase subunit L